MWLHVSQRNLILDCMETIRHQFVIGVEFSLKVPLASKSSFCMKVQTVGHKQNSGSYIAKCVSNWLLKCIIILYYQERPLLKFDQVSVSYSLIEVILFYCLAVKAKTVEEVIKNSPAAGVLDRALAEEYKVIFIAFLSCI